MCQSAGAGLYDPESMSLILNQRRAGFSEGTSLEKLGESVCAQAIGLRTSTP